MGEAAGRAGGALMAVDEIFAHPAFAILKDHNAAFVVVRPATGELLWANVAAFRWGGGDGGLGTVLSGPHGARWLADVASAVLPDRPPQVFRTGLAPGLRMRGATVLARATAEPGGVTIVGFAIPGSGSGGDAPAGAWRESAVGEPAAELDETAGDEAAGAGLARRGQLAVLRDRLVAAVDGAATLRFLWRTDAADTLTQIDDGTFERVGASVRCDAGSFADAIARFDVEAAERLRAAFAARATWSGVPVRLPVADGAATVPMTLSGAPISGPGRTFSGYRGFGTIDLGGLDIATRDETRRGGRGPDAALPKLESGPSTLHLEAPATPLASAPDSDAPVLPGEPTPPEAERPLFANVVDLRTFQALLSERAGIAHPPPEPLDPARAEDAAAGDPNPPSDEQAFMALGEALRARLVEPRPPASSEATAHDAVSRTAGPDVAPPPAPPARDADTPPSHTGQIEPVPPAALHPEAVLLDQLPIGVLVLEDGAAAYANAAAARLLAYPASDDVVAAGTRLGASRTETGLLLRGGDGSEIVVEGEPAAIDWDGAAATLWTLGAAGRPGHRMPPKDADAGAPLNDGDERSIDLLDRIDDAVALLDGQGRIRRLNRRGQDWFDGSGGEGAIGQSFTALLAPESRAASLQLLDEARARHEGMTAAPPRREILARTRDPAPVPMLLTMGRLGGSGFYATMRDVTELRRAERNEARSRRDRERDAGRLPDLLARVNHEIRTPLNAILGFAEIMMDERFGPLGSPRYRDYLSDIYASGTQVVALVGDLLDLSRIEAGRLDLDVGSVDVNKIVAEIVARMQAEAHRERIIVRTSLASRIPAVIADERSTRQIVQHLLSNAVKFNEPGGQVIVSTAQDDAGAVVLRIRDTGVGMTDAEIAAALEPFHDVSPPRPANGNGLGLPLARALVGANGASLSIRSRPREGTLVEVAFPVAAPKDARRPA